MDGLNFIRDVYPEGIEDFQVKKVFSYTPTQSQEMQIIIELELFDCGICLLKFHEKDKGGKSRDKYKVRSNVGAGHARSVLKACLAAYYSLEADYALMFSAINDENEAKENNARFTIYKLILSRYFKDYNQHDHRECSVLNTMIVFPKNFEKKAAAESFYLGFERRVKKNVEEEVTESHNPLPNLPEEFNYPPKLASQLPIQGASK